MSFSSRNILYPQSASGGNREYPTIPQMSTPIQAIHGGGGPTFPPMHSTPAPDTQGGRGASFTPMRAHGNQSSVRLPNWQASLDGHSSQLNQMHSLSLHPLSSTGMHLMSDSVEGHRRGSPDPPLPDITMLLGISEDRGLNDCGRGTSLRFEDSLDTEFDNGNDYNHSFNTASSSQDNNMVDTNTFDRSLGHSDSATPLSSLTDSGSGQHYSLADIIATDRKSVV